MDTFKRSFLITLLVVFSLTAAFLGGFITRDRLFSQRDQFPILLQAYALLRDNGLNPMPTPPAIEYGMIRGMVQAYGDPHTSFLEPPQNELETDTLQGKYGGIGVRLGTDAGGNHVLYPFPDSPAIQAGIKEGDRLLGVESLQVSQTTSLDTIQAAIRGPVDKMVTLTIARAPDYSPVKIEIKRKEIPLPSVTWHLEPSEPRLGTIEINVIAATTPDEIQKAVQDLQSRGATSFALDLRNNGGGLLDAGIDIARLFLKEGDVIQQQYRGQNVVTYQVDKAGPLSDIPMVLLVNENTASAAEIIAGSLQAHKRTILIGTTTYGKDTIQLVFNLKDNSSLHVTAAHWWIPGLEFPKNGHGLEPDIPLPKDTKDPQDAIREAIKTLFKQQ